jgi:ComF family protein
MPSHDISQVMIATFKGFTSYALDLVFPPSCVHCGREGDLLCHICVAESTVVQQSGCRKCAEPLTKPGTCARCLAERSSIDRLYGSYMYDSPVGSAIKTFKFDDIRAQCPVLADLFDTESMRRSDADLVVPVPLHRSRLRARGYNQSDLLGRQLAHRLDLEFRTDILARTHDTAAQSGQPTAALRQRSLANVFSVRPDIEQRATGVPAGVIEGKRILLVDDVFTTGSTVKSCATALKSAGASWVGVVALAVQPIGVLK